jgi:hypothetical protein
MIDFIIPSIGRSSLTKALQSLLSQTDPEWRAYVGFDGLSEEQIDKDILIEDARITYFYLPEKLGTSSFHGNAGEVRNKIISLIEQRNLWTGFLDDDDVLSQYYVELLRGENKKQYYDCYVFRMNHNGQIIPPMDINILIQNHVGISFVANTSFLYENNIKFCNDNAEDFKFLMEISKCNGDIKILPFVGYYVG